MTAIKPPGTDLPTVPHLPHAGETAATDVGASANAGPAGASFAHELGRAQQLAGQTGVSGVADPIAQLASELQAGKLSIDQALDALVDRAVGGVGRQLGVQERADLVEVLRAALGSDPTLAALRDAAG